MDDLFELPAEQPEWTREWQGMPEYEHGEKRVYSKLIVRFGSQSDLEQFSRMIGQKLNQKTKSIWHPALVRGENRCRGRYVDES